MSTRRFKITFNDTDIEEKLYDYLRRIDAWCRNELTFKKSEHVSSNGFDFDIDCPLKIWKMPGFSEYHFTLMHDKPFDKNDIYELEALFKGKISSVKPNFEHQYIETTFASVF